MTRTQALRMAKTNAARKETEQERRNLEAWRADHPDLAAMNDRIGDSVFLTSIPARAWRALWERAP